MKCDDDPGTPTASPSGTSMTIGAVAKAVFSSAKTSGAAVMMAPIDPGVRVGHPEALRGESRIDLVVDDLPVDDHHQPGSVGDRRSGARDGGRDRVGRRADRVVDRPA